MASAECPFRLLQDRQPRVVIGIALPQARAAILEDGPWPDISTLFPHVTDPKSQRKIALHLTAAVLIEDGMRDIDGSEVYPGHELREGTLDEIARRGVFATEVGIANSGRAFEKRNRQLFYLLENIASQQLRINPQQITRRGKSVLLEVITIPLSTAYDQARGIAAYLIDQHDMDQVQVSGVLRTTVRKARNLRLLHISAGDDFRAAEPDIHIEKDWRKPIHPDVLELG